MRVAAVALLAVLIAPAPSFAAGNVSEYTGASNSGGTVSVQASERVTSGGGGGGQPRRSARPAVDHRARYESLASTMEVESARETQRRADEARRYGQLVAQRDRCVAAAERFEARAARRVAIEIPILTTEEYTTHEWRTVKETRWEEYQTVERVPVTRQVRELVRLGWRRVWITRTVTTYTTRPVTARRPVTVEVRRLVAVQRVRPVWRTVTTWITVHDPAAAAQAAVQRRCADETAAALAAYRRQVEARRSVWNAEWAALNRAAHDEWRAFNTACRTIRDLATADVQECAFGAWRNYSPGEFERTITAPPAPPPRELIADARDQVTPPGPVIGMSPRPEWEQIVHVPTWLWVDPSRWRPHTARAEAGGAWAEATATPRHVVWDMGNGDRVTCRGPGTPYDESRHERAQRTDCSYTYGQSSAGQPGDAYTVMATLVYDVTWQGSGGAGGDLGTVTNSTRVSVRVAELQALVDRAG